MRFSRRCALVGCLAVAGLCVCAVPASTALPLQDEKQEEKRPAGGKEPTDFRKLREWLPAELAGLKRSEAQGQRFGTGADRVTMASGNYHDENREKSINIVVTDMSASEDPSSGAFWKDQEMDNESDTGYSKTTKIEGFPAFESFDSGGNAGNLMILVEDRVIVTVYTGGLDKAAFEKVRDGMSLKRLGETVKSGGAATRPADEAGSKQDSATE